MAISKIGNNYKGSVIIILIENNIRIATEKSFFRFILNKTTEFKFFPKAKYPVIPTIKDKNRSII